MLTLSPLATGCSKAAFDESAAADDAAFGAADLVIETPLALDSASAGPGQTVHGSVVYRNSGNHSIMVQSAAIAGRPPGGSHAGGPYLDFDPYADPVTVGPGATFTVQAARTFSADDPTGAWDVYPTFQDGNGNWHDGPSATLQVGQQRAQGGFTITTALSLSSNAATAGQTIDASVTYTNQTGAPVVVQAAAIAGRPPGGTHAGGPYDDFFPFAAPQTIQPGQSLTLQSSRTFGAGDPTGAWDVYPTYEDDQGVWHDGPDASLDVGGGGSSSSSSSSSSSGSSSSGGPPPSCNPIGNGGCLLPSGYLHTDGNQTVDESGAPVRVASVGWFDPGAPPYGMDYATNVQAIKNAGFNTVRLPWRNATMSDDFAAYDGIVQAAGAAGIKVIFDHHADEVPGPNNGWLAQQCNGLPIDSGPGTDGTDGCGDAGTVDLSRFINDWVWVAQHYAGNPTVIGFDLDNEPLHNPGQSTWGDGSPTDLRQIYIQAGNAIQAVNPDVLIIAEGPQNYDANFAGTGGAPYGDLSTAGQLPVTLNVPNKVVYSVHCYPASISDFKGDETGPNAIARMNADFGYLYMQNIAPVWIGEMGADMNNAEEQAWAQALVEYLNGQAPGGPTIAPNQKGMGTDWWAWGNLDAEVPNGVLDAGGNLRPEQQAVWSQLLQ